MCKFASFVLTKDKVFWLEDSDKHSEIISRYNLHESGAHGLNVVKVEISPTATLKRWTRYGDWKLTFDQDEFPDWHDPVTSEKRARAALRERAKIGFKIVNASDCTALTELKVNAAETVYVTGCTALTELKVNAAKYVYASGCTALKELKVNAKYVNASGCTALTELKVNAAQTVYASGCTALKELKVNAEKYVDVTGCTALTELKVNAAKYVDVTGCTALRRSL